MITVRIAAPDDAEKIENLFSEMLKSVYNTDDAEGYEDGYLDKFFGGSDRIYAAEADGEFAGYIAVEVHDGFIYLDDISVDGKFRGQGIGTILIEAAEKYASELGITESVLHVEKANVSAQRLYKRLGYSVSDCDGSRYRMTKTLLNER